MKLASLSILAVLPLLAAAVPEKRDYWVKDPGPAMGGIASYKVLVSVCDMGVGGRVWLQYLSNLDRVQHRRSKSPPLQTSKAELTVKAAETVAPTGTDAANANTASPGSNTGTDAASTSTSTSAAAPTGSTGFPSAGNGNGTGNGTESGTPTRADPSATSSAARSVSVGLVGVVLGVAAVLAL